MKLSAQIKKIIKDYCACLDGQEITIEEVGAALISGIALTCETLIKNDGSQTITAFKMHEAIKELVASLDFERKQLYDSQTRSRNRKTKHSS